MMQTLRNSTKPIFLVTIFAFIVGFIFLDIGQGSFGCQSRLPNALAVVNGEPIPREVFSSQVAAVAGQYAQAGAPLTTGRRIELEGQTYHQLVEDVLLRQQAEQRGLGTSIQEVNEILKRTPPAQVTASPIFQTEGQFDMSKYYTALGNPQFLGPLQSMMLDRLPLEKLRTMVSGTARVSKGEVEETHASRFQYATVTYVRVSPNAFATAPAALDASEVQAYFEAHKDDYTPERSADVTVAHVPRRPSAVDTLETSEVMESIYLEMEAGEAFDNLLGIHSEVPPSLQGGRYYSKNDPEFTLEFEQAVTNLSVGEVSRPFSDAFGFHIVRLDSTRTGPDGDPQYWVRDIRMTVTASSTTELDVERRLYAFWQAVRSGADFAAVADTSGVQLITPPPIDLTDDMAFVPSAPLFKEVRAFLNEAKPGSVSDIYEGIGGWYIWRLNERGSGLTPDLAAIESDVREDIVNARGGDAAKALAEEIAARAKAGESLEDLAASNPQVRLDVSRPFVRYGSIAGIGKEPEIIGTAFGMEVAGIAGPFQSKTGEWYVIRLDNRDPDPAELPASSLSGPGSLGANLVDMKREHILGSYLEGLREDAKIRDLRDIKAGTIR